jgi:N-acetylneuraminate synthase
MPAIKIASADLTNVPLLRKIGACDSPVILSVGAARMDEIATALGELRHAGASHIALLHCVLNYPTPPSEAQLAQISELARIFGAECPIGYSDHVKPDTDGATPALDVAALLGSVIIEKHFTDDKTAAGNDHYHAMDGDDLRAFTRRLARFRELYGTREHDLTGQSSAVENARRRIIAAHDIVAGETIKPDDLIALRSNRGIEIAHWDRVVGQVAGRRILSGSSLEWPDLQSL